MAHQHFLDDGKIEKLVGKLRSLSPDNPALAAAVRIAANYSNGMPNEGAISRLKRSVMFWTVRGANAVIALRCCRHSRQFDDYWEHRRG